MKKPNSKQLILIFIFVFLDLLGYSLILPLLPFYASDFGATIALVGLLGTVNGLGQLIAAPIIGRLSDRYGRRPLLIISIAGTILGFLLLGFAQNLWMVFISRAVDGLLGGNTALARAYITDITEPKDRSKSLGLIGAAFGLGFIIGPVMGGVLSQFGLNVPALVAAALSILSLIAVLI
ncbi:MAG: MFS transporter, partial [Anaerolineaceae bacterium]|nr:MFS transporter [Anaerolineaceae bacterium]